MQSSSHNMFLTYGLLRLTNWFEQPLAWSLAPTMWPCKSGL
jgi:hypothetical protein